MIFAEKNKTITSDELVGRLRLRAKMPPDHYKTTFDIEEAADRIEADAAEMERKDARIAELEALAALRQSQSS